MGDDGLASDDLWLGVILGYAFVLGIQPPNILSAQVCREWLSAELMKKLDNCRPHKNVGSVLTLEEASQFSSEVIEL
ncbi:hypothetical protein GBA52_020909 [Prunus armeniaca]|nr:hypothetical protein GBA52_020909 [Prunus armeniaca]